MGTEAGERTVAGTAETGDEERATGAELEPGRLETEGLLLHQVLQRPCCPWLRVAP